MTEQQKGMVEFLGMVALIVALAFAIKHTQSQAAVADQSPTETNATPVIMPQTGDPTEYLTWNYPAAGSFDYNTNLQLASVPASQPSTPVTNPQGVTDTAGCASCGCSSGGGAPGTALFADEQSLSNYYSGALKDFNKTYTNNILSSMPTWFNQYFGAAAGGIIGRTANSGSAFSI